MRRVPRYLSALLVLVMVLTSFGAVGMADSSGIPSSPLRDIGFSPIADSVNALYALGIITGVDDHTFGADQPVSRAQMAAFLVRATKVGTSGSDGSAMFTDVPRGYWASAAIGAAADNKFISGYQGRFRPDDQVVEAEAVTMVLRSLGYISNTLDYPVGYVLKARDLGLLTDDIHFAINDVATRGWVAQILARAVFQVPLATSNNTLSQDRFQVASALQIAPGSDYLLTGSTQLTLQGVDWFGKTFSLSGSWQVQSGAATVTAGGQLNVTGAGPVAVAATANGLTATKTYDVVQSLAATPATLSLQAGTSAQVKVQGVGEGKRYDVTPTFTVVSGPLTVAADGTITPTGSGSGTVRATVGSLHVDIAVATGSTLAITPAAATLTPRQTQQLQATLDGTVLSSNAVTWSLQGPGSISPTGLYTAAPGTQDPVVTAQMGSLQASVTLGVISNLRIDPPAATLVQGQQPQQFTVTGVTGSGKSVSLAGVTCKVTGGVGLVDSSCRIAGAAPGQGTLVASYAGLTGTAPITVSGQPVGFRVTPSRTSVPANGRSPVTLTVTLVDGLGNVVPAANPPSVAIGASPATLGSLDATQITLVGGQGTVTFTPTLQQGTVTVYVTDAKGTLSTGQTQFTTTAPVPAQIQLSTAGSTLQAGVSNTLVTATLLDSDNVPITNNVQPNGLTVTLQTSGSNLGTLNATGITIPWGQSSSSTTLNMNGSTGTMTIAGSSSYAVAPVTVSAVTAGPAAKLHITPGYGSVVANNVDQVTIQVQVQDANGVVRTVDNNGAVQGTLSCGAAAQTQTVGVQAGTATFTLRSQTAGACNFAVNGGSSLPVTGDVAQVTFKPGPATQLFLSVSPVPIIPADGVTQAILQARVADSFGNTVTNGSYQVTFTRLTSNQATVPPSNMTVATINGLASLPVTSTTSLATDTYTATVVGLNTVGTSGANVDVTTKIIWLPAAVSIQSISATTASVGQDVTVTVTVRDQNGYVRVQDNSTVVAASAPGSSAVITPAQQAVTQGVATFTVHETKAEALSLTITGANMQAANAQISYGPGALAKVMLTADATQLAADGVSKTALHAQGVDQYGNPVGSYLNLPLTLSSNLGTLSSTNIYSGNTVTFTAGSTPGQVTINAASSQFSVNPVTINLGVPGVPSRLVVSSTPSLTASNAASTIQVQVLDSNGNQMGALTSGADLTQIGLQIQGTTGTSTQISNDNDVSLSSYGFVGDGVTKALMPAINGVATFTLRDTKAETLTLVPMAYYRGSPLAGQPFTVKVQSGPATSLTVSPAPITYDSTQAQTITVLAALTDVFGNPVSAADGDTITLKVSGGNPLQDSGGSVVGTLIGGSANLVLHTSQGASGTTQATITSAKTGLSTTVSLVGDTLPDAPRVWAIDSNGQDYSVEGGEAGAKITILPTARNLSQKLIVMVNGQVVPLYTTPWSNTTIDSVPGGSASQIVGYIRRSDLGTYGTKSIQVMLQTSLGTGPTSPGQILTVNP